MTDSLSSNQFPAPAPKSERPIDYPFWRNARRSLRTFLFFFAFDLLFWFCADFRKFEPPSDGPFRERLGLALLTAAGPVGWLTPARDIVGAFTMVSIGTVLPIFLGGLGGRGCFSLASRIAGFAIWFFLGFGVAALRIR